MEETTAMPINEKFESLKQTNTIKWSFIPENLRTKLRDQNKKENIQYMHEAQADLAILVLEPVYRHMKKCIQNHYNTGFKKNQWRASKFYFTTFW